ncbi:Protein of unknown function [Gryllus bimaculatus]|nr:Protein of unknown function [Gryllus bimaculatus]
MERTVVNPSRFKIAPSAFDRRVIRTLDHRWRSSRWQGQQAPKSKGMLRAALLKLDTLLYGVCFSEFGFCLSCSSPASALSCPSRACMSSCSMSGRKMPFCWRSLIVSCTSKSNLLLVSSFRLELPFARLHQQLQNIGSEDALLLTLLDGILYQRIETEGL